MAILNLAINRGTTFGGVIAICKDAAGVVVPLAGYKAFAEVRRNTCADVVLDLLPYIAPGDTEGKITIPPLTPTQTAALPAGGYKWDIILQDPGGGRATDPLIEGAFTISQIITQPA